jgi:hypothetical protein
MGNVQINYSPNRNKQLLYNRAVMSCFITSLQRAAKKKTNKDFNWPVKIFVYLVMLSQLHNDSFLITKTPFRHHQQIYTNTSDVNLCTSVHISFTIRKFCSQEMLYAEHCSVSSQKSKDNIIFINFKTIILEKWVHYISRTCSICTNEDSSSISLPSYESQKITNI